MEFMLSAFSGVVGSAIFAFLLFFGKRIINKQKKDNYEYNRNEIKVLVRLMVSKDYRMHVLFNRLGYSLKYFGLVLVLFCFIVALFVFNNINMPFISSLDSNKTFSDRTVGIINLILTYLYLTVFWFFLGSFHATILKIRNLLQMDTDSFKKKITKYINKFSKRICPDEKEVLNVFLNGPEVYFSFHMDIHKLDNTENKDLKEIKRLLDYYEQDNLTEDNGVLVNNNP